LSISLYFSISRGETTDVCPPLSKLTASAAHLRGLIHMHLKATDLAKEAFMEALARDVKCFESFEMLVGSEMMSSEEGTLLVSPVSTGT